MSTDKHPTIKLCACDSSQLAEYGHDAARQTLAIKFKSGQTYHYAGVSEADFKKFTAAKSLGTHFSKHIRGKFKHDLIT